jgi:dihydrofolate reductase
MALAEARRRHEPEALIVRERGIGGARSSWRGAMSVVRTLMAEDLIDEYRLMTFPTIVGTGERLFPAGGPPAYLECLSAERAGAAALARFARAAP